MKTTRATLSHFRSPNPSLSRTVAPSPSSPVSRPRLRARRPPAHSTYQGLIFASQIPFGSPAKSVQARTSNVKCSSLRVVSASSYDTVEVTAHARNAGNPKECNSTDTRTRVPFSHSGIPLSLENCHGGRITSPRDSQAPCSTYPATLQQPANPVSQICPNSHPRDETHSVC
ncbi:hypothetical protein CTheo_719 [Ceratobasidium theobromae]|uniref:Uncharacterized protein n=1 Tax=Ceratobasidium theobromae TaxID=1582974 RepID=A0A5N5QW34_9AGAM|nr:hypothetical protein CTheo_719 [Ceratobasidium theobromae]